MATAKIVTANGREPTEIEQLVAQEMANLESSAADIAASLEGLYISAAREIEVDAGRSAIVLWVPYRLHAAFKHIQQRLIRELEKRFSGKHIVVIAERRILGQGHARSKSTKGPRPRSRTLTAVHEAMLEDVVYPTAIVGKRNRYTLDGKSQLKVLLDPAEQEAVEHKIDTFSAVYSALTHKTASFEFPVEAP